jgi:hypothetical protein
VWVRERERERERERRKRTSCQGATASTLLKAFVLTMAQTAVWVRTCGSAGWGLVQSCRALESDRCAYNMLSVCVCLYACLSAHWKCHNFCASLYSSFPLSGSSFTLSTPFSAMLGPVIMLPTGSRLCYHYGNRIEKIRFFTCLFLS